MKRRKINYFKYFNLFFAIAVLVFIAGCTGASPTTPIINSFSANPSTIIVGESSTLSWSVTDATSVTINQSIGSVSLISTTTVSPATTTTYTLTATNAIGSVTATTTITVNPALPVLLINYPIDPAITGGDNLSRGFYIKDFPGTSLSEVDLWISADITSVYAFELTARESTYDGTIIEKSTNGRYLTGGIMQLVPFYFLSNSIQKNSIVTFSISKIYDEGPCSYAVFGEYGGIAEGDILVIQTNGTTPPLDSFRRYGIAIKVYGHE